MQSETDLQQRFEACIEACADALFRVAFRLTGNETMARELVQETYLNAWKSLPSLSDPGKMRSWMFSILRNQYSKLMRVESRSASTTDQLNTVPAKSEMKSEAHELLQQGLESLDEKFKLPLLLVAMEQMSVEEAAEVLGLPRGTVLSRLHRGRKQLKEFMIRRDSEFAESKQKSQTDGN